MPDLTNEGMDFARGLTADSRRAAAYNALSKAYGPAVADDPTNAFKAAQASAEIPLAPQVAQTAASQGQANLQQSQIANTTASNTQQQLAAYRAAQILKSQAGPDGTIPSDAYDKVVRPNAALLGIDPAHVDQFGQLLAQPGGVQHLDQISQALIGPTKVTGAATYGVGPDGKPVAITKDQYGNIHQTSLGDTTPTQVVTAQTGQKNAGTRQFVAQTGRINAGTAQAREGVYANNSTFGGPVAGGGGTAAPGGAPAAGGPVTAVQANPQALFNRLPPKGKNAAIGQATSIVNQGTNLGNTNQILGNVLKQISPYTAGTGSLLKDLPGTQQADLKANLATLKAQGLMSWIASLKNGNGQTGIGRVLQSEANAASNLYGNMEQDQSAKQLAFHAQLFQQTVNKLYQHSNSAFKAMYGVAPHEAIGTDEPNTSGAPALPGGWKYLGVKQ